MIQHDQLPAFLDSGYKEQFEKLCTIESLVARQGGADCNERLAGINKLKASITPIINDIRLVAFRRNRLMDELTKINRALDESMELFISFKTDIGQMAEIVDKEISTGEIDGGGGNHEE